MAKNTKNNERLIPREVYKLENWSLYNQSLKNRGKITIWLSDDVQSGWYHTKPKLPGGEIQYSDSCIEFCLILRHLYHLPYRQTEGFVEDLLTLTKIELKVPSYSQIQRRSGTLNVDIRIRKKSKAPIDVVIDSTGLKVYGEGEWKVRKHGSSKRRTWRKLHMGSDGKDLEILSVVLTGNEVDDAEAGIDVMKEITEKEEVKTVAGDGGYDKAKFRKCLSTDITQLIPPQENAVLSAKWNGSILEQRDAAINRIATIGRKEWKKENGYHIRSLSEVNMFRFKKIFSHELKARKEENEETEIKIKCKILNKFVGIGMPISYKVS